MTNKTKWTTLHMPSSAPFMGDGRVLRYSGRGINKVWDEQKTIELDLDGPVEEVIKRLLEASKGLDDPYVNTYTEDNYGGTSTYSTLVGWKPGVDPEIVAKVEAYYAEQEAERAARNRIYAERQLDDIRKNFPDLLAGDKD